MRAWQTTKIASPKDALVLNDDAPNPELMPGTVLVDTVAAGPDATSEVAFASYEQKLSAFLR